MSVSSGVGTADLAGAPPAIAFRERRWPVTVLLAAALLGAAVAAHATSPPLPLPAWVKMGISLDAPPEMGREVRLRLAIEALVAPLPGSRYEITLPAGFAVVAGAREGTVDLEQGRSVTKELTIRADTPVLGATISAQVTTAPPKQALKAEIARQHKDDPSQRETGEKLVAALGSEAVEIRVVGVTVTPEEGAFADAPDPAFRALFKPAGKGVTFFLLDALPGMDLAALRERIKQDETRAATFKRFTKGQDNPVARMVAEIQAELVKLRYQEGLALLLAGQVRAAVDALAAIGSGALPGRLGCGLNLAIAAGWATLGDPAKALTIIEAEARRTDLGPTARYVEFDRGEVLRLLGRTDDARLAYQHALKSGPGLSIARARLLSPR